MSAAQQSLRTTLAAPVMAVSDELIIPSTKGAIKAISGALISKGIDGQKTVVFNQEPCPPPLNAVGHIHDGIELFGNLDINLILRNVFDKPVETGFIHHVRQIQFCIVGSEQRLEKMIASL